MQDATCTHKEYTTMNTAIQQPFKLLEKPQAVQLSTIGTNVLELNPENFKQALEQRLGNRTVLLSTIQENLVQGTDFLVIKIGGRNSKPFLTKAGAEKVCGMLALTVHYPNLERYEQMIFDGKEIKNIVIKCQLISANGNVVADGIGCRSANQDFSGFGDKRFWDINKAFKMALKSAHIDATLRAGGLSEVFTQDPESVESSEGSEVQKAAKKVVTEKQIVHIPPAVITKKKETIGKMPFNPTGNEQEDSKRRNECLLKEFNQLPKPEKDQFKDWMKERWNTFDAIPRERFLNVLNVIRRGITQSKINSLKQSLPYCDDPTRRLEEEMLLKELNIDLDILNGKL